VASITEYESLLVQRFVASFEHFGEMSADEILDPIAWQLATGERDHYERKTWRAVSSVTERSELEPLYAKLPARFPSLFERLVLSFRWAEVELDSFTLLANPPGPDLSGLLREMSKDRFLWDALLRHGFVRFGKGLDFDYDPVCFDIGARKKNGDFRIVRIDHEEILCNSRVEVVAVIAETFENVMIQTIEAGKRKALKR
jgi:hypothetical protein